MTDQGLNMIVFTLCFCVMVYSVRDLWRKFLFPSSAGIPMDQSKDPPLSLFRPRRSGRDRRQRKSDRRQIRKERAK
jgi:hypothetical protein